MALLKFVSENEAQGEIKDIYETIAQAFGMVPNALKLQSISPELLKRAIADINYYWQHPRLSLALLSTIRLLVSKAHSCQYCVGFNTNLLINKAGFTMEQVEQTKANPNNAPLDEKDKAMLNFVLKATTNSLSIAQQDIDQLKTMGWSEQDIFEALHLGARNVAIDILFNSLHLEADS